MKSLKDYLLEVSAPRTFESVASAPKERYFKVSLKGLDVDSSKYSEISDMSQHAGIYYEKTDDGFKIKIKAGDEDKLEMYIDALNDIAESNAEEHKEASDALLAKVGELMDIMNAADDDADDDAGDDNSEE